jgi:hypothetical protein
MRNEEKAEAVDRGSGLCRFAAGPLSQPDLFRRWTSLQAIAAHISPMHCGAAALQWCAKVPLRNPIRRIDDSTTRTEVRRKA